MKLKSFFLIAGLALATPVYAQSPTPIAAPAADRLQTAAGLMEVMIPPALREQMIEQMMAAMLTNIVGGMKQTFSIDEMIREDPEAGAILNGFISRQQRLSTQSLKANFPGMIEAMARAYARRFTVDQMREMQAFFETPAGQAYVQQSTTIMADPDVAAWQTKIVARDMARVQGEVEQVAAELDTLRKKREEKRE